MSLAGLKKNTGFYAGKDYNKNITSFLFCNPEPVKIHLRFEKLPFFATTLLPRSAEAIPGFTRQVVVMHADVLW